jgi:uncharacterized delta-60 repeat protein
MVPTCGNGIVESGEVCDSGAMNGQPWYCNLACTGIVPPLCGNGIIDSYFFSIWYWFGGGVSTLAVQSGGKIIVGGDFSSYNQTTANSLIRLNADGTKDTSFNIWNWFNNAVTTLAVQSNGKIVVGGNFNTYSWSAANYIIRLNADGTKDTSFNSWAW